MKEFIKAHKVRIWTIIIVTIVVGIAGIFGLYKATQWTNAHTIDLRSPFRKPWVIAKKGEETAKAQSLEEQVQQANETIKALQVWASSVDKTLPAEIVPKD